MAHIQTIPVALTTKGHRLWVQGIAAHGWPAGTTYNTEYTASGVVYTKSTTGKLRKVTAGKGCLIDTVGKKVTQWAQGATQATVHIATQRIHIERVA